MESRESDHKKRALRQKIEQDIFRLRPKIVTLILLIVIIVEG